MADYASRIVLLAVIFMLLLAIWRQFNSLGSRGQVLDSVGILPQWKFFAQSAGVVDHDMLDDLHMIVRCSNGRGNAGRWEDIFWNHERGWVEMFWNPGLRSRGEIQTHMLRASKTRSPEIDIHFQTSLTYLTLLRYCLDHSRAAPGGAVQFAIVASSGRGDRPLAITFVSAWHTP